MAKRTDKNLIVGLDIGTSKVVAIVGEVSHNRELEIIGLGASPSYGLKKGMVVNIDATIQTIRRAVEEAQLMVGCEIHSVYASIAGSHIRSMNSYGVVSIHNRNGVSTGDVERVIDAARDRDMSEQHRILHELPQEFIIGKQGGIKEPIGMAGGRLQAKVHIVTGALSATQNITKCVEQCGLMVDDIILGQLASSHATLTEDEKDLGVCLVDIGGGTTDIAIFTDGALSHTAVIPIAGDQVTNDIACSLRTPSRSAEIIKIKHGCAHTQVAAQLDEQVAVKLDEQAVIELDEQVAAELEQIVAELDEDEQKDGGKIKLPSVGDQADLMMTRQTLAQVVQPRYEELFGMVLSEIFKFKYHERIPRGVVLTGGSAKMKGVVKLAEEIFHNGKESMSVRVGAPQLSGGLASDVNKNPIYSTGVGLLLFAARELQEPPTLSDASMQGVWGRMKSWFQGNF